MSVKKCKFCWKPINTKNDYCGPQHAAYAQKIREWGLGGTTASRFKYNNPDKNTCERCGFALTAILEVHHKDGNHGNNSGSNLELLCPNCHRELHYWEYAKVVKGGYMAAYIEELTNRREELRIKNTPPHRPGTSAIPSAASVSEE